MVLPFGVRRDDVDALLPHLPADARARLARRSRAKAMRNLLLLETVRRYGLSALRTVVPANAALKALRPPLILGVFHIGPIAAMTAAVEQLQANVFVLRRTALLLQYPAHITVENDLGDEQRRALAFYRALERLRAGEFVVMALDPEHAFRLPVPCLGGTLQLARGPFALARIAGVPIVPVIPRWAGTHVELTVGEPLTAGSHDGSGDGHERALAESAGRWLEHYLLEHPEELSRRVVALMKELPAAVEDGVLPGQAPVD